jgi:hypothetical protein
MGYHVLDNVTIILKVLAPGAPVLFSPTKELVFAVGDIVKNILIPRNAPLPEPLHHVQISSLRNARNRPHAAINTHAHRILQHLDMGIHCGKATYPLIVRAVATMWSSIGGCCFRAICLTSLD